MAEALSCPCRGWKKRGGRSGGGPSPTDGLACPHGAMYPESRDPKARRQVCCGALHFGPL